MLRTNESRGRFEALEEKADIICVKTSEDEGGEVFYYIIENTDCNTPGVFDALGDRYNIDGRFTVLKDDDDKLRMALD